MPRSYSHIQRYEKDILELRSKGYTRKEIGERLGFTKEQIRDFIKRYNRKQRQQEEGYPVKPKGRLSKNDGELPPSIQKLDKLTQMRYIMASKDRYIKRLEMEIELMRDFLLLTERK